MALTLLSIPVEINIKPDELFYYNRPPATLKSLVVEVDIPFSDQVFYRNPNVIKSMSIELLVKPYPDTYTLTSIPNNANKTGFNDWNYKVLTNPSNNRVLRTLTGQSSVTPALSYSELKVLADNNPNLSYTIDVNGLITNLITQENGA